MIQMNAPMLAKKLGMTPDGVLKCANRLGVGTRIGKFIFFDAEAIEQITNNRPKVGRPKSDG
tara:strand:- start:1473 stop:1658 length:186 start_codon:yes stop_codon:yes gene_type:complete